jgi:hypothetical protein
MPNLAADKVEIEPLLGDTLLGLADQGEFAAALVDFTVLIDLRKRPIICYPLVFSGSSIQVKQ